MSERNDADDVLAHSEDLDEWDDEPVAVERRPSGSQVISARVPGDLADLVFAEVALRGSRPSDVVRAALEAYFHPAVWKVIRIQPGDRVRFALLSPAYDTTNPVVTTDDLPLRVAG